MEPKVRRGRLLLMAVVLITGATLGEMASPAHGLADARVGGPAGSSQGAATSCTPVKDFGIPWTTSLHGDVDGDGAADAVTIRARWLAGGGCRAWLVVDTAKARLRSPIEPLSSTLLKPPGLAGLITLRPGDRLDIAVVVELGASTGFVDVYGLAGHRLARLSRHAYEYAGSMTHLAGLDCSSYRGSRLVSSSALWVYADRRYHVTRTFYAVRAGRLIELPRLTERHLASTLQGVIQYPELADLVPFPSCTAVEGSS
ncbi:MAG TPA: hypothetical protein VE441_00435 [Mycobacterium sp.]|nr:hypothetical protein [Mycobacterium sp.]